MSVVLVPNLVNEPILLSLAVALWVALCLSKSYHQLLCLSYLFLHEALVSLTLGPFLGHLRSFEEQDAHEVFF